MTWITPSKNGVRIRVRVTPGADHTRILGVKGERLLVHVRGQPVKGEVNRELAAFIARKIGKRQNQITITAGTRGRLKTLQIQDTDERHVLSVLLDSL